MDACKQSASANAKSLKKMSFQTIMCVSATGIYMAGINEVQRCITLLIEPSSRDGFPFTVGDKNSTFCPISSSAFVFETM